MTKHRWYEPVYVGLVGGSRVGKDSTGRIFKELGYERVALADPLKDMAWSINPILKPVAEWYDPGPGFCGTLTLNSPPTARGIRLRELVRANTPEAWEQAKDEHPEVRPFLIDLGTAGRVTFAEGEDFWVNRALERAKPYTVFTDVRFLNEAARIRAAGSSFIVRIERPGYEPSEFEREVRRIPVDAVIVNDGSLEDLDFKVKEAWFDWLASRTGDSLFPADQAAS